MGRLGSKEPGGETESFKKTEIEYSVIKKIKGETRLGGLNDEMARQR